MEALVIKKSDKNGNLYIEQDLIRSIEGKYVEITDFGSTQDVVSVPSGKTYKLATLVIYNNQSSDITVELYDDTEKVYPKIPVNANDVLFLTPDVLYGVEFSTSVKVQVNATGAEAVEIFFGLYHNIKDERLA